LEGKAAMEAEETILFVSLDSHPLRTDFNEGPQNCVSLKELSDNHVCDFCKCACANCDLLYLIFLLGATGRDLIMKERYLIFGFF